MPTLVDTNVILNIAQNDAAWADWSDSQITALQGGGLIVNSVIYAELCVGAEEFAQVDKTLRELKISYEEISRPALFLAAKAFLKYRKQGGSRFSPLPDFYIGAQAQALNVPLLTRDRGRFATYFPAVRLICP